MKKIFLAFLLLSCFLSLSYSADLSDKEKAAKALVEKGIKFYLENGEAKAFAEFNKPDGKFVEGELYLFTYDFNGKCVSHGANKTLIGKDLIDLKDPKGKFVVKEIIEIVKKSNEGWIDFIWPHPKTKKEMQKRSFVKRIGDKNLLIGCGYYIE